MKQGIFWEHIWTYPFLRNKTGFGFKILFVLIKSVPVEGEEQQARQQPYEELKKETMYYKLTGTRVMKH